MGGKSGHPLSSRPRAGHPPGLVWVVGAAVITWATVAVVLAARAAGSPLLDPGSVLVLDNLSQLAAASVAAALCARTARLSRGNSRWSWTAFAVGAGGWAAGAAVWSWFELVARRPTPFPSFADVGYLTFSVGITTGMLLLPGAASSLRRGRDLLDGVMVAAALAAISWSTSLGAVLRSGAEGRLGMAVSVAYPISDVVVVTAAVVALGHSRGRRRTLLLLAGGLTCMATADTAFAYLVATGSYATGNPLDLGWIAAFLTIGVAAADAAAHATAHAATRPAPAARTLIPYIAIMAGFAVLVTSPQRGEQVSTAALRLLALASAAAVVRQYVIARENSALAAAVAAREAQLREQALRDPLTRLPNRTLFTDRVGHALMLHQRDQRPLAVVFCDLDAFKGVNDTLGHAVGDQLLIAVAARLAASLHRADTLARLGGDEFAALLEDPAGVQATTAALTAALAGPFSIGEHAVQARASIGVATVAAGEPTPSMDDLLAHADVAMYVAKRAGGAQVAFHRVGMTLSESRDLAYHVPLAEAVERDEIILHYQPIVELGTGLVVGFEALARWRCRGADVPPDQFIPLARRGGLLPHLSANLLRRACRQVALWSCLVGHRDVVVAVNISPDQIVDHAFVDEVLTAMTTHDVEPSQLVLEITEEALLADVAAAAGVMARLQRLGVKLSLDDFGTGYSSLAHLHAIPLNALKIDRAFVQRIDTDPALTRLVRGVLALSNGMGLRTIAEGIERPEHEAALRALGCRYGQGFLYSRPQPPEALTPLVQSIAVPGTRRGTTVR